MSKKSPASTAKSQSVRDKILGIAPDAKYMGGIEHFAGLAHAELKKLLELGYADPEDCQNNSPSIESFAEFMAAHPDFLAHGYAVHHKRSDFRMSLEGVELHRAGTLPEIRDFVNTFRHADEFDIGEDRLYCWFD